MSMGQTNSLHIYFSNMPWWDFFCLKFNSHLKGAWISESKMNTATFGTNGFLDGQGWTTTTQQTVPWVRCRWGHVSRQWVESGGCTQAFFMEVWFLILCNFSLELDAQAYVIDNLFHSQTNYIYIYIDSFKALLLLLSNVILPVRMPLFILKSTRLKLLLSNLNFTTPLSYLFRTTAVSPSCCVPHNRSTNWSPANDARLRFCHKHDLKVLNMSDAAIQSDPAI